MRDRESFTRLSKEDLEFYQKSKNELLKKEKELNNYLDVKAINFEKKKKSITNGERFYY